MAHCEVSILASEGKHTVSSLQLAEHFGLKHAHVLRDIRAILRKVPEEWGRSNFGSTEYLDEQSRAQPLYRLSRDGFTLLAMGYNSAHAIAWKLRYIEAFNSLERLASERLALGLLSLTPAERERIKKIRHYQQRGFTQREMAAVMGLHRRTLQSVIAKARSFGLLEVSHGLHA